LFGNIELGKYLVLRRMKEVDNLGNTERPFTVRNVKLTCPILDVYKDTGI